MPNQLFRINKSKALAQYKLHEKDLDGLHFHVGKCVPLSWLRRNGAVLPVPAAC